MLRPADPVTYAEAAHILGVTPSTVRRHVLAGRLGQAEPARHRMLSRSDVEKLALQTYRHRQYAGNEDSYWVTGRRAAEILGPHRRDQDVPPRAAAHRRQRPAGTVAVNAGHPCLSLGERWNVIVTHMRPGATLIRGHE